MLVCLLAVLWSVAGYSQAAKTKTASKVRTGDEEGELPLARAKTNPLQLLRRMREGADLHYHLNRGTYAETMLRNALDDGLCADMAELALTIIFSTPLRDSGL